MPLQGYICRDTRYGPTIIVPCGELVLISATFIVPHTLNTGVMLIYI